MKRLFQKIFIKLIIIFIILIQTGATIYSLANEKAYKTTILTNDSLGEAGDCKITVAAGMKYEVTVNGTTWFVDADGKLKEKASDAANLKGTEIIGLKNGETYKVEIYSVPLRLVFLYAGKTVNDQEYTHYTEDQLTRLINGNNVNGFVINLGGDNGFIPFDKFGKATDSKVNIADEKNALADIKTLIETINEVGKKKNKPLNVWIGTPEVVNAMDSDKQKYDGVSKGISYYNILEGYLDEIFKEYSNAEYEYVNIKGIYMNIEKAENCAVGASVVNCVDKDKGYLMVKLSDYVHKHQFYDGQKVFFMWAPYVVDNDKNKASISFMYNNKVFDNILIQPNAYFSPASYLPCLDFLKNILISKSIFPRANTVKFLEEQKSQLKDKLEKLEQQETDSNKKVEQDKVKNQINQIEEVQDFLDEKCNNDNVVRIGVQMELENSYFTGALIKEGQYAPAPKIKNGDSSLNKGMQISFSQYVHLTEYQWRFKKYIDEFSGNNNKQIQNTINNCDFSFYCGSSQSNTNKLFEIINLFYNRIRFK